MAAPSYIQQRLVLDVACKDLHELRIDARTPYRQRVADDPQHQPWNPQLQAEAHGGGQRAVGDRHGARRAAQQDRLGQRAAQRHLEASGEVVRRAHTTAPPEKLKNDRKNEDAANAIERPNTICTNLRKLSMAIYFDPPLANKIDPPGMV